MIQEYYLNLYTSLRYNNQKYNFYHHILKSTVHEDDNLAKLPSFFFFLMIESNENFLELL